MGLVHHHQKILREVVEETGWPFAGDPPGEMPRIVLDPGAGADLEHHLDVESCAGLKPLCLEQLSRRPQFQQPDGELLANQRHGALDGVALRHEVLGGIDRAALELRDGVARDRVEAGDPLDLIPPEFDPYPLFVVGWKDLHRIATHPEGPRIEGGVVPLVLDPDEILQNVIPAPLFPDRDADHEGPVGRRIAQAINGGDGRHDHDVVTFHERGRRPKPQRLQVLIDRGILLDVDVGRGDVRFGLVVVVVRDEVFDCVAGEELLHLAVELRRERLVVGEDQRRFAVGRDRVCQGHRLAAAGDSEQGLIPIAPDQSRRQFGDGTGLIPGGLKGGDDLKLGHSGNITGFSGDVRGQGEKRNERGENTGRRLLSPFSSLFSPTSPPTPAAAPDVPRSPPCSSIGSVGRVPNRRARGRP